MWRVSTETNVRAGGGSQRSKRQRSPAPPPPRVSAASRQVGYGRGGTHRRRGGTGMHADAYNWVASQTQARARRAAAVRGRRPSSAAHMRPRGSATCKTTRRPASALPRRQRGSAAVTAIPQSRQNRFDPACIPWLKHRPEFQRITLEPPTPAERKKYTCRFDKTMQAWVTDLFPTRLSLGPRRDAAAISRWIDNTTNQYFKSARDWSRKPRDLHFDLRKLYICALCEASNQLSESAKGHSILLREICAALAELDDSAYAVFQAEIREEEEEDGEVDGDKDDREEYKDEVIRKQAAIILELRKSLARVEAQVAQLSA